MADVVLVYPDLHGEKSMGRMLPLSLLYTATPIVKKGYRVLLIDQRVDGQWPQTLKDSLLRGDVLCVGISSMTGSQIEGGLAAGRIVKKTSPRTPVIWGGVHSTIMPDQTARHPCIDAVVVGEGEETFSETVDQLASKKHLTPLPGLCFEANKHLIEALPRPHVDLNALSPLCYDLVNLRDYTRAIFEETPVDWIALLTSRGCPFGCTYCYTEVFNKRQWRALTPERTLEEIERIIQNYSIHHFFLFDDNFFVDQGRVRKICRLLSERRKSITVHNANWRVDSILSCDMNFLNQLKSAGFKKVFVGVESGSDEILKRIGKGFRSDQVLEANRKLRRAGIKPVFAFMAGFPFESQQDVKATLCIMDRLLSDNPDARIPGMSLYSPFPGTHLFQECLKRGMAAPKKLEDWCALSYSELTFNVFQKKKRRFFQRTALLSQFLDPKNTRGSGKLKDFFFVLVALLVRERIRMGIYGPVPEVLFVRRKMKGPSNK